MISRQINLIILVLPRIETPMTHFFVLVIELRRVVPIKNLSGLTKLLKQGSQEFVLHIKKEHDYRLYSEQ